MENWKRWSLLSTLLMASTICNATEEGQATSYFDRFKTVQVSDQVDPANPPEYLRIRMKDLDGKPITLFLEKYSVRRDHYAARVVKSSGTKDLDVGEVRTYRGWIEELPDCMVTAVLYPDGQVRVGLLRALYTQGWGSATGEGPGDFTQSKASGRNLMDTRNLIGSSFEGAADVEFLSGSPEFVHGKSYPGASFAPGKPKGDAFFEKTTLVDQSFLLDHDFFDRAPQLKNKLGNRKIFLSCEGAVNNYNLLSLKCGLEAMKISEVVIPVDYPDRHNRKRINAFFEDNKGTDFLCKLHYSGGGGAGNFKKLDRFMPYVASLNAMHHELGHLLNWGGDTIGRGVEIGLMGGSAPATSQRKITYGTVAVENRMRQRKRKRENPDYDAKVEYIETPRFPITPYARIDRVSTDVNAPVRIDFLLNDFDVNGNDIALASFEVKSANGGEISFAPKGGSDGRDALRYTPVKNFIGEDRFSYSIVDSDGCIGYGNVIVGVVGNRRVLSYMSFDDVDEFNEHDYLKESTNPFAKPYVSVNWHKHRTTPFLAYWNVARVLGRGGYFDPVGDALYENTTTGKEKKKAWDEKEFTFDVTGQPFLKSPAGLFDVTFYRWAYINMGYGWVIKGAHPQVTIHQVSLWVDGVKVAVSSEEQDFPLDVERLEPGKVHENPDFSNTTTTYRLRIKNPRSSRVKKSIKEAIKLATERNAYIHRYKNGALQEEEDLPEVGGPKVEVKVTLSKTEGVFVGGAMMVPVNPDYERLAGKFGNCIKLHGFEEVNYRMLADGNVNRTLAVWVNCPDWKHPSDAYIVKNSGKHGVAIDWKQQNLTYSNIHVNPFTQKGEVKLPLPPAGKWFHLALVFGKEVEIYIDGDLLATYNRINFKSNLLIERLGFQSFSAYDDLRIYSGTLGLADIQTIMEGGQAEFLSPFHKEVEFDADTVQWIPGATAVRQKIYFAEAEGALGGSKAIATLQGNRSAYKPNLLPNTHYFWRVDTILKNGELLPGTPWAFTTGAEIHSPAEIAAAKRAE